MTKLTPPQLKLLTAAAAADDGAIDAEGDPKSCAAYILSQAGEGWTPLPGEYDDGGYSGGTTERPGIQALMAEIRAGRVDVVVVYKVDPHQAGHETLSLLRLGRVQARRARPHRQPAADRSGSD